MYHSFGTPSPTTLSWQKNKYKEKKTSDMESYLFIKHKKKLK